MRYDQGALNRRAFFTCAGASAGLIAAGSPSVGLANRTPHPHKGSLDYLDPATYQKNVTVHAHLTELSYNGAKMQMMARWRQRFLFSGGDVIDVTDSRAPQIINKGGYIGRQIQLAYNRKVGKWILMTSASAPPTSTLPEAPRGKYDAPWMIDVAHNRPGLRGVRIYDASDPRDIKLLSKWSCDQGDPDREFQTGGGTHRNYYDGGRYAFLDAAPDDSFVHMESPVRAYTNCLQVIDLEDPANPKFVSNWWFPGQRAGEEKDYRLWREYDDRSSFTSAHGGFYTPVRIENGGRYCYSSYGSFGITIHDVSDPAHPELVGNWRPRYMPGGIPFHTCDVSWLDRGFVIGSSETLNPDCFEPFHPNYVVDVRDVRNPKPIAVFGEWRPPSEAPYDDFCDKRGRFGAHNPPHLKAPGKRHKSFIGYAAFNAGFQFMDFSNPEKPRMDGWFIPPSGGDLNKFDSYNRIGDNIFVEWDRRLIWASADSGIYLLSHKSFGAPVLRAQPVSEWTLDGLNEGHDG